MNPGFTASRREQGELAKDYLSPINFGHFSQMKITQVEFVKSVAVLEQLPRDNLKEVAFAGRSNVGKSSLINCLLNRKKMAKTSSTPGKTRLLNYFRINDKFYFVDLPGYGFAKVSKSERQKWQQLIESFVNESRNLKCVISIIDCKVGPTVLDLQLLEWLSEIQKKVLVVATKVDKLSNNAFAKQKRSIEKQLAPYYSDELIAFSSVKGTGKKHLLQEISSVLD